MQSATISKRWKPTRRSVVASAPQRRLRLRGRVGTVLVTQTFLRFRVLIALVAFGIAATLPVTAARAGTFTHVRVVTAVGHAYTDLKLDTGLHHIWIVGDPSGKTSRIYTDAYEPCIVFAVRVFYRDGTKADGWDGACSTAPFYSQYGITKKISYGGNHSTVNFFRVYLCYAKAVHDPPGRPPWDYCGSKVQLHT